MLPLSALAAQAPSGLQKTLDAELARFPGRAGIWVKHLTTGEEAARSRRRDVQQRERHQDPGAGARVSDGRQGHSCRSPSGSRSPPQTVRGGSGIFRFNDPGLQPTLRDVLLQMIITSDNTATDLAIGEGGRRRARERLAARQRLRRRAQAQHDHRASSSRSTARCRRARRTATRRRTRTAPTGSAT